MFPDQYLLEYFQTQKVRGQPMACNHDNGLLWIPPKDGNWGKESLWYIGAHTLQCPWRQGRSFREAGTKRPVQQ